MGFQFIDNQPIRFKSSKFDDQSCINKDLSAYNILMKPGDPLHWQAKLRCCEEINLACNAEALGAELVTDPGFATACGVNWTCGSGWTIGGGAATYTAPSIANISQAIAITAGRPYKVSIKVSSNSTGFGVYIYLGSRLAGVIAPNVTGVFEFYGNAGTTGTIAVVSADDYSNATTGTFVIDDLSVKGLADCYTFETATKEYVTNGTFTGSSTGWFLGTGWTWNAGDYVLHTTPGALIPVDQSILIPHRHNLTFGVTITLRTAGSIEYYFGGILMLTITATTSFNSPVFGIGNNFLQLKPIGGFDGAIDNVTATEVSSGWLYDPDNGFCHEPGWTTPFYAGNTLTIGRYYKMTVEVIVNTLPPASVTIEAGGVILGMVTKTGIYEFYFTALTSEGERFTPSINFDGCILDTVDICQLFRTVLQTRLVYEDGITGATDWHTTTSSSNPVILDGEWVTWRINSLAAILSGGAPVALPYSCYRMQVKVECDPADPVSISTSTSDTVINYAATHGCTKLFMAYCDGDALDFNFGYQGNMFRLYSRLRTLYFNPSYPVDVEDYEFSSGLQQRIFATRKKKYELLFDYCDEYAHDVIGLMIVCDTMIIDNVQYIADGKDYEPEWADRGKRNLAQSIIELQKSDGVLFNRNCS